MLAWVQGFARSMSIKDVSMNELLKAHEKNNQEMSGLDKTQRKLLDKCYSFDNKVASWKIGAGGKAC